jgi:hypothetical protein
VFQAPDLSGSLPSLPCPTGLLARPSDRQERPGFREGACFDGPTAGGQEADDIVVIVIDPCYPCRIRRASLGAQSQADEIPEEKEDKPTPDSHYFLISGALRASPSVSMSPIEPVAGRSCFPRYDLYVRFHAYVLEASDGGI